MAIAKKGKRQIEVGGQIFFWYVSEDVDNFPATVTDADLRAVNILSEDKQFLVRYHLGQNEQIGRRHITVLGKIFPGTEQSGTWRRFASPHWCVSGTVTPGEVSAIISWCYDKNRALIEVDYQGIEISQSPESN